MPVVAHHTFAIATEVQATPAELAFKADTSTF
jgi:hypothetical protein